jgi:hypothetical protein
MPAVLLVIHGPAKVTMPLLCIFGTGFMIWFLVGLIAERSRAHARYIVRLKLGKSQSVQAFPAQTDDESFLDEAGLDKLQPDRTSHFPAHGFRIRQHF